VTQTDKQGSVYRFEEGRDGTAVSYGCKAYFFNKPGDQIPGGSPSTYQSIYLETGYAIDFNFEVIQSEVKNIDKCIVALVVFEKLARPTGIDEEQRYSSHVDVLEVDPSFELMNRKYFAR
jgi:hypothetical protein